ncbi:tRNA pseudouridine(55) synthase TruB [Iodidimonas sp. SYSU 1G8]|uniref:tRNA pseudouridine(55) synthase TruB n=1 Tax=Iodidimonas sp. SYSU 1G8 TaxID=3133967 RepID=UPI0031FEA90B
MGRRNKGRPITGWIVVDKPQGVTSAHAVARVKRMLDAAKVGHAGTLDPLATGVLPLALGDATKLVSYAMGGSKTYKFTVQWGEGRDTDDSEGAVTGTSDVRPDAAAIEAVLPEFTGLIQQKPPSYSAIKVDGERAYDLARDGAPPDLPPREVQVDRFSLLAAGADSADFEVDCGKGTYVRSLARDLGVRLGTFGHVTALRRTRVGPFHEADSFSLDKIGELGNSAPPSGLLLPIETPLDDIPAVAVMESEADRLRHGQAVFVPRQLNGEVVIKVSGKAVGLGVLEDGNLKPKRLFNS